MVALVPITRDNWRRALEVRVAEGQLPYVADSEPVALVILAKAYLRVADLDWWPLLVEADGTAVGVAALVDERARHDRLALFHLVVDRHHQRRGLGRAAVRALVALAGADPRCQRLRLTVVPDNRVAVALYRSEGFRDDGLDAEGELGMSLATPTLRPG
jgi:diamine N-acetyltransferase